MIRIWAAVAAAFLVAACAGAGKAGSQVRYGLDGGAMQSVEGLPALMEVAVRAPSWLESPAFAYRLAYADGMRRESYAQSRWVAPPSEMVAVVLKRALPVGARGCRLQVELDEFIHEFSSDQASVGRLEARVKLLPSGTGAGAVRQFVVTVPAGAANASGGALALNAASAAFVSQVREWLGREAVRGVCAS